MRTPRFPRRTALALLIVLALAPPAAANDGIPAGLLDVTFGNGGIATVALGNNSYVNDVLSMPDRDLVGVGGGRLGWLVMRLRPTGKPDPTFSGNGLAQFDVGGGAAYAAVLDPQGRLVVVGDDVSDGQHLALARILPDGRLDWTFGTDGIARIPSTVNQHPASSIALDGGRIVVAYTIDDPVLTAAIARFTDAGFPDPTFGGGDGVATLAMADQHAAPLGVFTDPDGSVVVGGALFTDIDSHGFLARFTSAGDLDPSFGDGGVREVTEIAAPSVVVRSTDGFYMARGALGGAAVIKLDQGGEPDPTFGGDGVAIVSATNVTVSDIVLTNRGRPVVAGWTQGGTSDTADVLLVRFRPSGRPDRRFGTGGTGIRITDFGGYELTSGATIQGRKLVVCGDELGGSSGGGQFPFFARYTL
jgi:uncharacterized delta-60 repeat protein